MSQVELGAAVRSFNYVDHDPVAKKNGRRIRVAFQRLRTSFIIRRGQRDAGAGKTRVRGLLAGAKAKPSSCCRPTHEADRLAISRADLHLRLNRCDHKRMDE